MTDSSTGGYVIPDFPPPAEDKDLEIDIQNAVVGITGMPADMVRPRWQPNPPRQPTVDTNWCAFGIMRIQADTFTALVHNPAGDGTSVQQRHETLEVLGSFYGPNAHHYAALLRDGLMIVQNLEALYAVGIMLYDVGQIVTASDLISTQWVRRYDLTIRLRRQTDRTYPIRNVLSTVAPINQSH